MKAHPSQSVFLDITPAARIAILFFLFTYRIVFPIAASLLSDGSQILLLPRIVAEVLFTLLLAYPFIFHRPQYGWLHPLVLPALFMTGKNIVKNPLALVFPVDFPLVDFTVETWSSAAVLSISSSELARARLGEALLRCLAQALLLIAFLYGPRLRVPRLNVYRPKRLVPAALAFIGISAAISLVFVVSQGGFAELLIAMRGGRRELFAESGQILFAAEVAVMVALVWFGYEKRPFGSPLFLISFAGASLLAILVTGSRSALLIPMIIVVLLWWKRSNRPLILPTAAVALFAILVLGIFGSIRQDFGSTRLDLSVLNPTQYGEVIDSAYEETRKRSDEEANLAAFQGANTKGLLFGRTYATIPTFWIPRAVWNDKPKPADAYNMWVNFAGNSVDTKIPNYGYWGIPVSAQIEAYWNFHLAGVAVIFVGLGLFYRLLADAAYVYHEVPLFLVLYLYFLIDFNPTGREIVDMIRTVSLLVLFAFAAGIFRLSSARDRRRSHSRFRSA